MDVSPGAVVEIGSSAPNNRTPFAKGLCVLLVLLIVAGAITAGVLLSQHSSSPSSSPSSSSSVSCAETGPNLGPSIAPVLGLCYGASVYGASSCNISCAPGYIATNQTKWSLYSCYLDGLWYGTSPPTCAAVSCGVLSATSLGLTTTTASVSCNGSTYGSSCTATCAAGYTATPPTSATITCGTNGQWQGSLFCTPVSCGSLLDEATDSNATYLTTCSSTTFGATCTLTCLAPYYGLSINNALTYTCSANGAWVPAGGVAISCPPNPVPFAYQFQDSASGCPPTRSAGVMMQGSCTFSSQTIFFAVATSIRFGAGRFDMNLNLDNNGTIAQALPYTTTVQWLSGRVFAAGFFLNDQETHQFQVLSSVPNVWGCNPVDYDRLYIMTISNLETARLFSTYDSNPGCPNSIAAGSPLMSLGFNVINSGSAVFMRAREIRSYQGRADIYLNLDGNTVDCSLSYTTSLQWEDMSTYYTAALAAGTHTLTLTGSVSGIFECDTPIWGGMDVLIIDNINIAKQWNIRDQTSGCPNNGRTNPLLTFSYTQVSTDAVLWLAAHTIRAYSGRLDLYLVIDGVSYDHFITWTDSTQWYDAHVYFSGKLGPGTHTIQVTGDMPGNVNYWGCGSAWGSISALLVGEPGP